MHSATIFGSDNVTIDVAISEWGVVLGFHPGALCEPAQNFFVAIGTQREVGAAVLPFDRNAEGSTVFLPDLFLELHDGDGALIETNNNWRETQETALQNTGLAPADNLESAILVSVPPGSYTAVLKGVDGGTGNGLIEVYKVAP